MKKLIWLPLAGFLLIAGAAAAAAAPGVVSRAQSILPAVETSPDPGQPAEVKGFDFKDNLLSEVLDELVADGTINQSQADAITSALQDKIEAKRAEMEQLRALWQQFIADGVITQAEIDQLPADSPFRQVWDSIAQDGQVTLDQLRQFGPFGGHGHGGPGGFRFHTDLPAPDGTEEQPSATPGS